MTKTRQVYIINGNIDFQDMFERFGWEVTADVNQADLLQFTGGEDVYPGLYGEEVHRRTRYNPARDKREVMFFELAKRKQIPMVGVCRGGQFLNVMCGGWLWQDVDGHNSGFHDVLDMITGEVYQATSTHHQMMRITNKAVLIAAAGEATWKESCHKIAGTKTISVNKAKTTDPEVVWYGHSQCLCVQFHPEYDGCQALQKIYFDYIDDWLFDRRLERSRRVV